MTTSQTVQVVMQQVTKTSTAWADDVAVIRRGVICVELADDTDTIVGVKVGIGDKTFADLNYVTDPTLGTAAGEDADAFDPAGTAAAAVAALVAGATSAGDTLAELEARIAAVEALGSLATDAELVAAVADLIGDADADADTLGELEGLIGARLAATANLSDLSSAAAARANLGLELGVDVQAQSDLLDDYLTANVPPAALRSALSVRNLAAFDEPASSRANGPLGVSDSGHVWLTSDTQPWSIDAEGRFRGSYPGSSSLEGWAILQDAIDPDADCWTVEADNIRATWVQGVIVAWADADNYIIAAAANTDTRIHLISEGVLSTPATSGNPGSSWYPGNTVRISARVDRVYHVVTSTIAANAGPNQSCRYDFTGTAGQSIIENSVDVGFVNQHPYTYFNNLIAHHYFDR